MKFCEWLLLHTDTNLLWNTQWRSGVWPGGGGGGGGSPALGIIYGACKCNDILFVLGPHQFAPPPLYTSRNTVMRENNTDLKKKTTDTPTQFTRN